jgi:hypothetical protein
VVKKTGHFVLVAVIALLFASLIPLAQTVSTEVSTATVAGVTFGQINFYLDGVSTLNSDWGDAHVGFYGSAYIQYLNLISNGNWTIQNLPVLSVEGEGMPQTQDFWFPLGVPSGTHVTNITYGIKLTPNTLGTPPTQDTPALVSSDDYVVYNGGADVKLHTTPPPAAPVVGGAVADPTPHENKNFPNQPCGVNECAPTAVSNSMQFLNDRHKLGMDPTQLTIDKMKKATNWGEKFPGANGCWIQHNNSRPEGQRNAWWEDKDAYMKTNKLPITTTKLLSTDIGEIAALIDTHQDIEMELGGHTVAVVGIADLGGGKYSVTIKHDKTQGVGGVHDLATETGKWDSKTGTWSAALAGYELNYFVVECPITVGGFVVPVDKFGLLAPYIGLASTAMIGAVATAVYVKRVKRRKEKQ